MPALLRWLPPLLLAPSLALGQGTAVTTDEARAELAFEPRPLRETFADTVRWLVDIQQLKPREAGRLAEGGSG